MNLHKPEPKLKIGLQVKSILVLTVVIFAATTIGGWFFYTVSQNILRRKDRSQAEAFVGNLTVTAVPGLVNRDRESLQRLAMGLLGRTKVRYVCILDRHGETAAVAERVISGPGQLTLAYRPVSISYDEQRGDNFLELGRPVVAPSKNKGKNALVGAVRLVLDTRETSGILANVRRKTTVIVAVIVICMIPLGYLLTWRVIVMPIRRLMKATHQLAEGDFSARVETCRNDEIGELAGSFDTMVEKVRASQRRLRQANESLEQKVADRTVELQCANRRLNEEMTEKEDFLRSVSHDLNAPLRNIAGMATMISIKYRQKLPEEVISRLQRIQSNVDAETELIGELLELSRIKTRPEKRRMVDFNILFKSLAEAFEYELKAKNITFEIDKMMPRLFVENNRIRQVFQNLIDNAIKYMGDRTDAKIRIGYDMVDDMHQISVTDNGQGISEADQKQIFQVFRRASAATSAGVPGKGVGLAMVKRVASNYDGQAWVVSSLGKGSAFYFSLSAKNTAEPVQDDPVESNPSCETTEYAAVDNSPDRSINRNEMSINNVG
ncbi:MAG: HAMP domain-containing sensor histidine kinase [Planctomycetota bacterium]|nr:HAMP domain-containing sensor histidine kinase [Planctomycetota bacterium]